MTNNEQNEAIAEWLGWTVISDTLCDPKPEVKNGIETGEVEINPIAPLPDYCNDLNAMNDAEEKLSERQKQVYASILDGDNGPFGDDRYLGYIECPPSAIFVCFIHATAAERAKALLITLGLWKGKA